MRLLHKCITPMYHCIVLFLLIIYGLNSPNYLLGGRLRFTNFAEQGGLHEKNVFIDELKIYTLMSWINFIFIFSNGLEIFSTLNIHHPVYGCPIHVLFNLTKSTIDYHRLAGRVSPASWHTPSSGEKVS